MVNVNVLHLPGTRTAHGCAARAQICNRKAMAGQAHLVPVKRAQPVASATLTQHGLAVLARADDEEAIRRLRAEVQVHHRPGVATAPARPGPVR